MISFGDDLKVRKAERLPSLVLTEKEPPDILFSLSVLFFCFCNSRLGVPFNAQYEPIELRQKMIIPPYYITKKSTT